MMMSKKAAPEKAPTKVIRMFHRVEGVTPMQYREEHAHGGTQRQDRRGSDEDFDQDR